MSKKKKKLPLFLLLTTAVAVAFIGLYSTGIIFSKDASIPDDQIYTAKMVYAFFLSFRLGRSQILTKQFPLMNGSLLQPDIQEHTG